MKKISIAILALITVLSSCKKVPEVNLKYVDVERDLITVGMTTATVQCDYQYIATLKKAYFYYGEGENEVDMNTAEMRVAQNTLYVELVGLRANTTYSYYYEFYNGFNSMRTVAKTFKTETTPVVVILPTVITAEVTEIAEYYAQCGGEVTNDGGAEVTERGICWSTNENPTLNDNHVAAGVGLGVFAVLVDSLQDNTIYHVRAYAINEAGTAYGLDREFTTLKDVPDGAIDGLFTINEDGDQVYFSRGNLQYQASTNSWRFAENQWDFVGSSETVWGGPNGNMPNNSNHLISSSYSGWIDLFGWGTSGYNHGAISYQPWSIVQDDSQYYAYGSVDKNLNDETMQADWGYNPISNGGNSEHQWRTMTEEEWCFVIFSRSTPSSARFVKARVNETNGVILLPDEWRLSVYPLNKINDDASNYMSNVISLSDWSELESNGAVFLPASGMRIETSCGLMGSHGTYHTATISNLYDTNSMAVCFLDSMFYISGNIGGNRCHGAAVRLVQDSKP